MPTVRFRATSIRTDGTFSCCREIGEMESRTIGADEVAEALGMSCAYAHKLIHRLNRKMKKRRCITVPEQISYAYFEKLLFGGEEDSDIDDKG